MSKGELIGWCLLALMLVLGLITLIFFIKSKMRRRSSGPAPANRTPWPWKEILKWSWRVALLAVIIWGIRSCNSKTVQENARLKQAVVEAEKVRQATFYTFTWFKSSTDYDPRGQEMTLDLAVLQDDDKGFEAKMIQNINGIKTAVGSLSLSPLKPGRVVGMWANLQDGDGGNVELNYKGNGLWTGNHQVHRGDGSRRDVTCDIRKEIKPVN